MTQPKPKTHGQLQRIFGLAKPLNCGKDDLEELAFEISNGRIQRLSLLSFDEANAMIDRLGGEPFGETPRRTVNYRRQKAGVHQIATRQQLQFLSDIADKRGIKADGLERLCRRMLDGKPKPRTTADANKIIEAIKAMNKRDQRSASVSVATGSIGRAA